MVVKKVRWLFFFLFFLHGFSIGNGQQGISYNGKSIAASGADVPNSAIALLSTICTIVGRSAFNPHLTAILFPLGASL